MEFSGGFNGSGKYTKLKSYGTIVKACDEEYVYYDKKLRERHYKFKKHIIVLDDNAPFGEGEKITVISESDFQKLFQDIKKLKEDKESLMEEIEHLQNIKKENNIKQQRKHGIIFGPLVSQLKRINW
jgi:ABC-type multidrug transport system ATPase subunit